jgi:L-fuculose-phosphate aldolase
VNAHSEIRTTFADDLEAVARASRRLGELGYVASHGGNLSCRVSDDLVCITPTQVVKREMTADDIVIVSTDGAIVSSLHGRRPTGETPMHLLILSLRPDLDAIVHAHPPVLTGFSLVDSDLLQKPLLPEPVLEVGPVISVPYAEPVSDALARQFESLIDRSNAWLMRNHGITIGSSEGIDRALEMLVMTEAMAASVSVASAIGPVSTISREEVQNMERTLAGRSMPLPADPRRYTRLVELFF